MTSIKEQLLDLKKPDKLTAKRPIEAELDDLLALIDRVADTIIGEDEPVNMQGLTGVNNQYYLELDKETRNKLKAEQRQRYKEMKK